MGVFMNKNFFYRITAADFLAKVAVMTPEQRGEFAFQFALDLVGGESEDTYTQSVIAEAAGFKEQKSAAGRASAKARKDAKIKELEIQQRSTPLDSVATESNTPSTSNSNSNSNSNNTKPKDKIEKTDLRPPNISDQVWSDFKQLRTSKKAKITKTALEGYEREAKKAGITIEQAFTEAINRNWVGFKADWYLKDNAGGGNSQSFATKDYGQSGDI
jgi:hypothetical protein